jgi:L-lactate dehydrogenase complex protein LldG
VDAPVSTIRPDGREVIRQRIGAASAHRAHPVAIPRDYHGAGATTLADPVGLFIERVTDYRATVRTCPSTSVVETIRAALAEQGARRIVTPPGLPPAWIGAAIDPLNDEPPLTNAQLDGADGVLTVVATAIATTGTVVLDAGPGQGRRALTLLPDYHLAVVSADQIVASVPDAIAVLDPVRPLTWISGPSATSDIELLRVEGVHGPRRLELIVILPT